MVSVSTGKSSRSNSELIPISARRHSFSPSISGRSFLWRLTFAAVAIAAMHGSAISQTVTPLLVEADATEFKATLTDGRVLRSRDLIGGRLVIAMDGRAVRVRIDGVEPDPEARNGTVWLHTFSVARAQRPHRHHHGDRHGSDGRPDRRSRNGRRRLYRQAVRATRGARPGQERAAPRSRRAVAALTASTWAAGFSISTGVSWRSRKTAP